MLARSATVLILGVAFLAATPNVANRFGAGGIIFAQAPAPPPATPPAATPPAPPATTAPPATPPVQQEVPPSDPPAVAAPAAAPPAAAAPPKVNVPLPKSVQRPDQPAKELFAARRLPTIGAAIAIGYYPKGCLAGGVELPINGPTWQVMRLSRNRNWGHPNLVNYVKKFSQRVAKTAKWPGILVGDLSQPRGGPMLTGHLSHQIGLDVDVWFTPMPDRELTRQEREEWSAINVVAADWKELNRELWKPQHVDFIKAATQAPEVERVLVNAAIKKELCKVAGADREWLAKVRPFYGHHDHIHVRLSCPAGAANCKKQPPIPGDEDCGAGLDSWFTEKARTPRKPPLVMKQMMVSDLPAECKTVLDAK